MLGSPLWLSGWAGFPSSAGSQLVHIPGLAFCSDRTYIHISLRGRNDLDNARRATYHGAKNSTRIMLSSAIRSLKLSAVSSITSLLSAIVTITTARSSKHTRPTIIVSYSVRAHVTNLRLSMRVSNRKTLLGGL